MNRQVQLLLAVCLQLKIRQKRNKGFQFGQPYL